MNRGERGFVVEIPYAYLQSMFTDLSPESLTGDNVFTRERMRILTCNDIKDFVSYYEIADFFEKHYGVTIDYSGIVCDFNRLDFVQGDFITMYIIFESVGIEGNAIIVSFPKWNAQLLLEDQSIVAFPSFKNFEFQYTTLAPSQEVDPTLCDKQNMLKFFNDFVMVRVHFPVIDKKGFSFMNFIPDTHQFLIGDGNV